MEDRQLTIHNHSRFTPHDSRFTATPDSRLTIHASRFTIHDSRLTIHASRFTATHDTSSSLFPAFVSTPLNDRVKTSHCFSFDSAQLSEFTKI